MLVRVVVMASVGFLVHGCSLPPFECLEAQEYCETSGFGHKGCWDKRDRCNYVKNILPEDIVKWEECKEREKTEEIYCGMKPR